MSDASAPFDFDVAPGTDAASQLARANAIMMEQTRALRRRQIVGQLDTGDKQGGFWGIATRIGKYGLTDPMTHDSALTESLQYMRTRLNRFSDEEQGHLINWGYALADAAVRRYLNVPVGVSQGSWPEPNFPL